MEVVKVTPDEDEDVEADYRVSSSARNQKRLPRRVEQQLVDMEGDEDYLRRQQNMFAKKIGSSEVQSRASYRGKKEVERQPFEEDYYDYYYYQGDGEPRSKQKQSQKKGVS